MSKRILSIVLMLTLVLGSFSMAFATDVPKDVVGTEVEDAVTRLGNLGILTGYEDGSFKPEGNITRAEFAAVVSRARGLEQAAINAKGKTKFGDVAIGGWASGYVNVSDDAGLIKGMGIVNGINTFGPELNITYEQAVTMIVRALGYEPAAQANGGYPTGHLIVASQEGLLRDVKGVQGQMATRGLVAQLTDNALDIEKMIQVGYGDQAKFVKSGTENTKKVYLFDDLGYKRLEKATITDADKSKNKVVFKVNDKDSDDYNKGKTLKVAKDFNFAGLEGLKVTVWYDDKTDTLVDVKVETDFESKFDAIEVTKEGSKNKEAEIKLITEDKKYDVDEDAIVKINGNKKNISDLKKNEEFNFAKLVLNEYNNVSWIEAYDLNEMIVVEELSKDVLKGYDNKEIDKIEDFTIIKNGKQITEEDLDKEDVVLYNDKEEYAVVVTNTKTDEIERVYKDGFKFDGEIYDFDNSYDGVKYIVNKDLEDVDEDVLEAMQDNGKVTVYFSFDDEVLFIDGEADEIASNYVMIKKGTERFQNRGEWYYTLDVLNDSGKVVEYEVKEKDIEKTDKDFLKSVSKWESTIVENNVVELTIDSGGKVSKVKEAHENKEISKNIKTGDSFAEGYKLQGKAVVFWRDGESEVKNYPVLNWSDASKSFREVEAGTVYADDQGRVVAIFADKTDNDEDTKSIVGVLRNVQERSDKKRFEFEIEVNGKETIYEGKKDNLQSLSTLRDEINKVVELKIGEKDNEVRKVVLNANMDTKSGIATRATSNRITVDGQEYRVEGKYYDDKTRERKDIAAKDVEGKNVTLYMEPGSSVYVQVVVLGGLSGGEDKDGTVTYINATGTRLEVDGVVYTLNADTRLVNEAGTTLAIGNTDITSQLDKNDIVKDIKIVNGVVTSLVKLDAAEAAKVAAATTAVETAEETKTAADIATAQTLVNGLATGTAKTNLQNRINAIEEIEVPKTDLEKATAAVEKAETSKLQADVDAAQLLVDVLPAGQDKVGLNTRLSAIVVVGPSIETGVRATGEVTTAGIDTVSSNAGVKATTKILTDMDITAVDKGIAGNNITIEIKERATTERNKPLAVEVTETSGVKDIAVLLETDALGITVASTSAQDIMDLINNDPVAKTLVVAENGTNPATAAVAMDALTGGVDEVEAVTAVAEVYTLTITSGATKTGTITVKGLGADIDVNVVDGMTADMVATAINAESAVGTQATVAGYGVAVSGDTLVFTANIAEAKATSLDVTVVNK